MRSWSICSRDNSPAMRAVAQDQHAVGQLLHLAEAMRDVEDADAFGAEVADDGEELIGFVLREAGGGLVHNEDAGVDTQRFGDFDKLLMADGQVSDDGVGGAIEANFVETEAALSRRRDLLMKPKVRGSRPR